MTVELATPAGPVTARAVARNGRASLALAYARAGELPYRVTAGQRSLRGAFGLQPGFAVRVDAEPQPRAVRVGGDSPLLLVAQPLDEYGNVPTRPVKVIAFLPDGSSLRRWVPPTHLLLWSPLPTGVEVGEFNVSVTADATRRELVVADVLPGVGVNATLQAGNRVAWADARGRWRLDAGDIRDALGNEVVTGSAATFVGSGPQGLRFTATLPTVNGQSRLDLSPPRAGLYRFFLRSEAARSSPLNLFARPGLGKGALRVRRWGNVLILGPLFTVGGALVDTGTGVVVTLLSAALQPLREDVIPVVDGLARYEMPVLPPQARFVRFSLFGERVTFPLTGKPR